GSEDHHVPRAVAGKGIEDEVRVGERCWTVAHPPIVAATAARKDNASLAGMSRQCPGRRGRLGARAGVRLPRRMSGTGATGATRDPRVMGRRSPDGPVNILPL